MFKKASIAKRISILVVAAACAVVAVSALCGCSIQTETEVKSNLVPKVEAGSTLTEGTLTVGINAANSPYGGTNNSKEIVGLDVDIAAALADELGCKLKVVDVNSNGRAALTDKQVDIVLGLTKSGNSTAVVYSPAYINDGTSLFCLEANKPASIAEVTKPEGKVLVQAGTASAYAVQSVLGIESLDPKQTMDEAFKALAAGEQTYLAADAVIGDYFARNYENMVRVDYLSADSVTPIYAVTLADNASLTTTVDEAMSAITQNGVLRVIAAKWLGTQANALLPGQVDISQLPTSAFGVKEEKKESKKDDKEESKQADEAADEGAAEEGGADNGEEAAADAGQGEQAGE